MDEVKKAVEKAEKGGDLLALLIGIVRRFGGDEDQNQQPGPRSWAQVAAPSASRGPTASIGTAKAKARATRPPAPQEVRDKGSASRSTTTTRKDKVKEEGSHSKEQWLK